MWLCLCFLRYTAIGQGVDTLSGQAAVISRLLDHLENGQVKTDGFYYAGTFPTLRSWSMSPSNVKTDNAIFYTGLIVFTLRQLAPYLHGDDRSTCDSIIARGVRAYLHYQNRKGLPSYNFWPPDKPIFFPHSILLDRFKDSKQIADDLDDTSILYLGSGIPDSTAKRLKALMDSHANGWVDSRGRTHRVRNSYRATRHLPAYSAWFGERTPIEFDAGVFCNILYFVYADHLSLDEHDTASIQFLAYILKERKYLRDPAYASSYYPRSPVLIYHLARLLGRFDVPGLSGYKPQLIEDAKKLLRETKDPMDRVILGTALIRLGAREGLPEAPEMTSAEQSSSFVFYIANISCLFPNPIRRMFLENPLSTYYFFSPDYNDALLLEYLLLSQAVSTSSKSTPSPTAR